MRRVMEKRKKTSDFNEAASELYELPLDAGGDMNNSFYFTAHDSSGQALLFRLGKRGGGGDAEVWFAYRAADGTAFVNSRTLFKLSESAGQVKCIEPLRTWEFSFNGKMTPVAPGENLIARACGNEVTAEFKGVFTAQNGLYEFSRDTDTGAFASAVSAEQWKKGFSEELNKNHQIHIEQAGHIKGRLIIGQKEYITDAPALRDHSYGRRVWSYMNRHTWLICLAENGDIYNANMVRYPALNVRGIKTGYKMTKDGVFNVTKISFPDGVAAKGAAVAQANYKVCYSDKSAQDFAFTLDIAFPFDFENGAYTIYEGISTYTVGGLQGRGISEFGYNKDKSRYETPPISDEE